MQKQQVLDMVSKTQRAKKFMIHTGIAILALAVIFLCFVAAFEGVFDASLDTFLYIMLVTMATFVMGLLVFWHACCTYSKSCKTVAAMLKELIIPTVVLPELEDCSLMSPSNMRKVCRKINMPHHDIENIGLSLCAKYKGRRKLTMTDLELIEIVETVEHVKDKDGNVHDEVHREEVTVFCGQIFAMENFPRPPKSDVHISSRAAGFPDSALTRLMHRTLETESLEFNRNYRVRCDSGHEMFYVLTPALIDRMNGLAGKQHLKMLVDKDGVIYLAVNSGKWLDTVFNGKMPTTEQEIDQITTAFRDHFLSLFAVFAQLAPEGA